MPRARAAAAAIGLPEPTAVDFHLNLGREIARVGDHMALLDAESDALRAKHCHGVGIIEQSVLHTLDLERSFICSLAAHPAQSLAGAAVQLAAAVNLLSVITREATPMPEDERAIARLLTSALAVVAIAAGVDVARDGIDHLAVPCGNPWIDPRQRVAAAFPDGTKD